MGESPTGRRYGLGFWCAVALVVLAVYVGTYGVTVSRQIGPPSSHMWELVYVPRYAANDAVNEWLTWALHPVHLADRKIRADYWTEKFSSPASEF